MYIHCDEIKYFFIHSLIPIKILSDIAFFWAFYGDIKKISIGLGISYGFIIISYFLFNLIVTFTVSKERKQ